MDLYVTTLYEKLKGWKREMGEGTSPSASLALLLDREQADYERKENAGQFTAPARHAAVKTIGFFKSAVKRAEAGERRAWCRRR